MILCFYDSYFHIALFTLDLSPESVHLCLSPRMLFHFFSLPPWVYIHSILIESTHIYICVCICWISDDEHTVFLKIPCEVEHTHLVANELCQVCRTPTWLGSHWAEWCCFEQSSWYTGWLKPAVLPLCRQKSGRKKDKGDKSLTKDLVEEGI